MRGRLTETETHSPLSENDLRDPISTHLFIDFFLHVKRSHKLRMLNHAWRDQIDNLPLDYKALFSFWLKDHKPGKKFLSHSILQKNKHFNEALTRSNKISQLTVWERLLLHLFYSRSFSMHYFSCEDAVKAIILLEPVAARNFLLLIKTYQRDLESILADEKSDWATLLNVLSASDLTKINSADIENALKNVVTQIKLSNTIEDQLFIRRLSDSIYASVYAKAHDAANFTRCTSDVYRNLENIDLSGSQVNLSGMQLSYNRCQSAVFDEATLIEINLTGAKLKFAKLRKANLSRSLLVRAELSNAILSDAIMDAADLSNAFLKAVDLVNARLVGAKLTKANIQNGRLIKADFSNSLLQHADIGACNLFQATLTKADLSESLWIENDLREANFISANLFLARLLLNNLNDANFENANLSHSDLTGSTLIGTNLRNADLGFANLCNTKLDRLDLQNAKVNYAIAIGAEIYDDQTRHYLKAHGAIMTMADLAQAYTSGQISVNIRFIQELCVAETKAEIPGIRMNNSFASLGELMHAIIDYRYRKSSSAHLGFFKSPLAGTSSIDDLLLGLHELDKAMTLTPAEDTAPTMRWTLA